MTQRVAILERSPRHAPFGLRVWDLATGTGRAEGLEVGIAVAPQSMRRRTARENPSGIYYAQDLPGLAAFEYAEQAPEAPARRTFQVTVRDPRERFLPLDFTTRLPADGLVDPDPDAGDPATRWPWGGTPVSPPAPMSPRLPLFSQPARRVSEGLAAVHAEVREFPSRRPAAWCLLAVASAGVVRGWGVADREGRVTLLFPYPPLPPRLLTSPPAPRTTYSWPLTLSAWYLPGATGAEPPEAPALPHLRAQLAAPRTLLGSLSPLSPLGEQTLDHAVPLTVRTAAPRPDASFLFIATP